MCFLATGLQAQIELNGRITDGENGEPLLGATIFSPETQEGTITDFEGNFKLEIKNLPIQLSVKYVGFMDTLLNVVDDSFLDIVMTVNFDLIICTVNVKSSPILVNLPAPIMRLRKIEIQREDQTRLDPILNRTPGVYMHSGALNTNRITLRGIGSRTPFGTNKIRAYLNEIPLTSGAGETNIEDIDLSFIKEIDVWKGPTASIYGAGLGGMIHLKTENNFKDSWNHIKNEFTLGSFGSIRNVTSLRLNNDKYDFYLSLNDTRQDSYRQNNRYERQGINLFGTYQFSDRYSVDVLINYIDLFAEIPSSINMDVFQNEPRRAGGSWGLINGRENYKRTLAGLSNHFRFDPIGNYNFSNTLSLSFAQRSGEEIRPFNIVEDKSNALTIRNILKLTKKDYKIFPDFSLGFELFSEQYDSEFFESLDGIKGGRLNENEENRFYANVFAQSYLQLSEQISLLAGLNLNSTNYRLEDLFSADGVVDSGEHNFNWILSPRIALNYAHNSRWSLFANVSHGFSPPSLEETLTPDGAINSDIQPETGWNFEMGSRGKLWRSKLVYELSLYQTAVSNLLIQQRVSEDQFIGINAGETRHRGLEAFLQYTLFNEPERGAFFISYTLADYEFIDFENQGEVFSGNKLTGTPPHHLNIGIDLASDFGLYGNITFQYVDAFPIRDDNTLFTDPYQVVNLKIAYDHELKISQSSWFDLGIYFGIRNVLDEKYSSMILINAASFGGSLPRYFYPGLPRNFYGGVKAAYRF